MKALIWIVCILASALVTTLLKYQGITLGAIPSMIQFGLMWWLATKLCKLLDKHRQEKKDKQTQVQSSSDSESEEPQDAVLTNDVEAPENERKILDMITSKRIAGVISILLCVTLYLSFLSAFTTKKDTYICYTTKTGECFHSATCNYLNTAYETTVYEASQKYKACKYCNPCIEQYKTTITERNYIIPAVISVPISAVVFVLLAYKKKK